MLGLPYDRQKTTMQSWPLDEFCASDTTIPRIGDFTRNQLRVQSAARSITCNKAIEFVLGSDASIRATVEMLRAGKILAVKGLGGYHLVCDARDAQAVKALRSRKFRKEKPFALMAKNLKVAETGLGFRRRRTLLTSAARPIVIAPARINLPGVAPENNELGVMLPYTPLHHLLFAAGAPDVLVMTSANRSSEPIAF